MKQQILGFVLCILSLHLSAQEKPQLYVPQGKGYSSMSDKDKLVSDRFGKYTIIETPRHFAWLIYKDKIVKSFSPRVFNVSEYSRYGFTWHPDEFFVLFNRTTKEQQYDSLYINDIRSNTMLKRYPIMIPDGLNMHIEQLQFLNNNQIVVVYRADHTKSDSINRNSLKVFLYELNSLKAKEICHVKASSFKSLSVINENMVGLTFVPAMASDANNSKALKDSTYYINVRKATIQYKLEQGCSNFTPGVNATTTFWRNDSLYLYNLNRGVATFIGLQKDGFFMNYSFKSKPMHVVARRTVNKSLQLFMLDNLGKRTDSVDISQIKYLREKSSRLFLDIDLSFDDKYTVHEPTSKIIFTNGQDLYSVDLANKHITHTSLGSMEKPKERFSVQTILSRYRPENFNAYKLDLTLKKVLTTKQGAFTERMLRRQDTDTSTHSSFIIFHSRFQSNAINFYESYYPVRHSIAAKKFDHVLVNLKNGTVVQIPKLASIPEDAGYPMKCFDSLTAVFTVQKRVLSDHICFLKNETGELLPEHKLELNDIEQAENAHTFFLLKAGTIFKYNFLTRQLSNPLITIDTTAFYPYFIRYHKHINKLLVTTYVDSIREEVTRIYDAVHYKLEKETKSVSTNSQHLFSDYWLTLKNTSFYEVINLKHDSLMFQFYPINDSDWVVKHSSGLFDASAGAMRQIYFLAGLEPIDLAQLKDRYYEPGLADKLLGINKEPIRPVKGMMEIELFPDAELVLVDSVGETFVYVNLTNRGGGLGKTTLFVNGKEVIEDMRPKGFNTKVATARFVVNLSDLPYFVCGAANAVEVKTWNEEAYVQSKGAIVRYQCKQKSAEHSPRLHVLSIGISDYHGTAIDLRYASKDALSISRTLELGGRNLFGVEQVTIYNLNTETGYTSPNRTNILAAFQKLKETAHPADVVVLYFSGHGINHGGSEGDFYYLTQDAFSASPTTYTDIQLLNTLSISSKEIANLAKQIPALKQVLIIDACGSGKAVDNLMAGRDIESSTIRALDRMKDRTGMHIIAGCAANAVSYEASRFGQGLLTYSLLEGIKGAALRESQYQDVALLFQYARDRVSVLARDNGVEQEPRVFSPYGNESFDIGIMTANDKLKVPLAMPKPLFVKSNFMEDTQLEDVLGLSTMLNEKLSEMASKGYEAQIAYIDVNEFSSAYKISGRYQVAKNGSVNMQLRIKGSGHDKSFKVKAKTKEELIKQVLSEIDKLFVAPVR